MMLLVKNVRNWCKEGEFVIGCGGEDTQPTVVLRRDMHLSQHPIETQVLRYTGLISRNTANFLANFVLFSNICVVSAFLV